MEPNTPARPDALAYNGGARRASVAGLAVVGFIALIILGLWLALYIARSLSGKDGLGAVGDYVDSMFSPSASSTLAVVPSSTPSTIPFGESTSTANTAYGQSGYTATNATTTPPPAPTPKPLAKKKAGPAPTYYRTVTTTYPVPGATRIAVNSDTATSYYGLPDLSVKITAVGYFDSSNNFIATSSVPIDSTIGAQMIVTNIGTNKSGQWDIKVSLPTSVDRNFFQNQTMDSLNPGQPALVTMRLDIGHPRQGTNYMSVSIDPDNKITESNKGNNTDTTQITAY